MTSMLQDWVAGLGLRHQGVLVAAVRGCDTAEKDSPTKMFVRCYRGVVLKAYCGDPAKARSFIESVSPEELERRFRAVLRDLDQQPFHYVMHLVHAISIVGYKHSNIWLAFYYRLVHAMHLNPETEAQLDARLNASEEDFA